jgi:hypothetical protein
VFKNKKQEDDQNLILAECSIDYQQNQKDNNSNFLCKNDRYGAKNAHYNLNKTPNRTLYNSRSVLKLKCLNTSKSFFKPNKELPKNEPVKNDQEISKQDVIDKKLELSFSIRNLSKKIRKNHEESTYLIELGNASS